MNCAIFFLLFVPTNKKSVHRTIFSRENSRVADPPPHRKKQKSTPSFFFLFDFTIVLQRALPRTRCSRRTWLDAWYSTRFHPIARGQPRGGKFAKGAAERDTALECARKKIHGCEQCVAPFCDSAPFKKKNFRKLQKKSAILGA
jgi:hypothetical protein